MTCSIFVLSSSIQSCPPGLSLQDDGLCTCIEGSYNSIITCGPTCNISKTPSIIRGGWIGNYSGEIVGGLSFYRFSATVTEGTVLPSDWSDIEEVLCGGLHRKGIGCGDCIKGYGPSTDIYDYECVKCTSNDSRVNWLWYILLEYIPLTVMFVVLVIFDINATSGAGNAFIFFAQMVTTIFDIIQEGIVPVDVLTSNHTHAIRAVYQLPYGIWNLEFFSVLAPPFCLSQDIGTYGIIVMNYAIGLYPIFLIFLSTMVVWLYGKGLSAAVVWCKPVYYCILRIQRKWEFRRSMLGVFATFITLSYTKMLLTSVKLVMPEPLYTSSTKGHIAHANVPAFNGNLKFTDPNVIAMYILAIVILTVYIAVLPCLLATPSLVKALHRKTKWEWLAKILPWGRVQQFLEGFHSCYVVSGKRDYRWFSGLFLVLRGTFFLAYAFTSVMAASMLISGLCFVAMVIITWTRPFKVSHHNTLNVAMFCVLGLINSANTFNAYRSVMWLPTWAVLFWLEYLLVLLPLLVIMVSVIKSIKRRCVKTTPTNRESIEAMPHSSNSKEYEDERKDSLMEGDDTFDFLRFTEDTGRLKRTHRDVT